jgi:beta-lactamase regulating signal transducer with metallopeptidase domain
MTGWLVHLAVSSAGLAAAGGVLWLAAAAGRKDPVALYRFGVAAVVVTLGLLAIQAAIGGVQWLWAGPMTYERHEKHYVLLGPGRPAPAPARTLRGRTTALSRDRSDTAELFAIYIVGAGAVALYHGERLRRTVLFLRGCWPSADAEVLAVWRRVAEGSALRDRVRLLTHPGLAAPCCWGLGRPYLVVPDGACAADELEWGLRHELVHLERGDARVAVLQALLTVAFWFHPVAWWLSRRLDEWRELSCDQLVMDRTGRRKSYALALLAFAARLQDVAKLPPAPRAGLLHGSDSHLRRRIKMLAADARFRPAQAFRHRTLAAVLAMTWLAQLALSATLPAAGRDRQNVHTFQVEIVLRQSRGPSR